MTGDRRKAVAEACRQRRFVIDGFERDPLQRVSRAESRSQIVGRYFRDRPRIVHVRERDQHRVVLPMHHGDPWQPEDFADHIVYILDFSFPKELMDYIFANAKRVVWLDHHASSRVMAEEFCNAKD